MNDRIQKILDILKQTLPDGTDVSMHEIRKANGVTRPGIVIRHRATNVAPVFYLDMFGDLSAEQTALTIMKNYARMLEDSISLPNLLNYDEVKEHFNVRLYNIAMNQELLKNIPYVVFLDLAVAVMVTSNNNEGLRTTNVTTTLLSVWGKAFEEVLKQALNNLAKHETVILPLNAILKKMFGSGCFDDDVNMYIMMGDQVPSMYGAAHMLNTGKLNEFALMMESDIAVIPSSVHEVLLVPVGNADKHDIEQLNAMVKQVNETYIDRDEWLSDHVYIYRILGGWENCC